MIETLDHLKEIVKGVDAELKFYRDGAINVVMNDGLILMTPCGRPPSQNIETMIKLINDEKER